MKLRELRKSKELTKLEFAKLLYISKSYYEKLEDGLKRVNVDLIKRIVEIFPDIDLNWLIKNNSAPTDRSATDMDLYET